MKKRVDLFPGEGVKSLVDHFYAKVNQDELLSPIFNEFAGVQWDSHLNRMYSFWDTILFAKGDYKGSPFDKHLPLPIHSAHFKRWLQLFEETLDEHFEGEMTEQAKSRAHSIGMVFESKLNYIRDQI